MDSKTKINPRGLAIPKRPNDSPEASAHNAQSRRNRPDRNPTAQIAKLRMKQAVPTAKLCTSATIRALGTKPISMVKANKYGAFSAVATFLIIFIISVTTVICLQRQFVAARTTN